MNVGAALKAIVSSFITGFLTIAGANGALGDLDLTVGKMAVVAGGFAVLHTLQELLSPTSYLRPVADGTVTAKLAAKPAP